MNKHNRTTPLLRPYNETRSRFLCGILLACSVQVLVWPGLVLASSAIAQSFVTLNNGVVPGSLVSLVVDHQDTVQLANVLGAKSQLAGVTIAQPLLSLSAGSQHTVQVAVGGTAPVMVSDMNGPVRVGDKISASPIAGVGMKATEPTEIIGAAQSNLSSVTTVSRGVTDRAGRHVAVNIGLVPVAVNVEYYSASPGGSLSAFVPAILQDLANAISGKQVSPLRVLASLAVLMVGATIVIVMLRTAVKNGIVSIGRNPLAEKALRKGLVDVLLLAAGVLLVSGAIIYALLAF